MLGHETVKTLLVIGGVGLLPGACSESETPLAPAAEAALLLRDYLIS